VAVERLTDCIVETLGVDVRSAWQTGKARRGEFQAERSRRLGGAGRGDGTNDVDDDGGHRLCTQQIDNLLVGYTIEERHGCADERSAGSGAEDIVVVHSISLI